MTSKSLCYCGHSQSYADCCGRYIDAGAYPRDPESLMRSRYSAYACKNLSYLKKTWHPDTCPELTQAQLEQTEWLELNVISSKNGLKKGFVEFEAYYKEGNGKACLKEHSMFVKVKGRWLYYSAQ
ncbi:YchJ family protein [Reinekea thalattae]|uniref:YchJ-like middle NTF2-like domain-containing protein n=1 Tax=Reinekea thalattae TaxID=2593301 RepID=A0A5C8ZAU9_9GAMM|nr:YchJ family metal-binding protein [Reinekea thalattae]TXR53930.1 hypothetical protein FME95_05095 [Reinekea thalattae]